VNNKNSIERSSKRPRAKRKRQYRIRNWSEYNAALVQRGSLTIWLDEAAAGGWYNHQKSGRRGASCTYTDSALLCALTLQLVYHLPLRATQGLLLSLFELLGLALPVPDYSTLSRRRKRLPVPLSQSSQQSQNHNLHLVVDSTGFKVYGEGEWKVRVHGWSKHRTWRKLHLGIDQATGQVQAAVVTPPCKSDKAMLPELLDQVEGPITQVSGDGGYDYADCYEAIAKRGAKASISPRCNARIQPRSQRLRGRNENLERIRELQGRRQRDKNWGRREWKKESGYHRRSLVETGVMRLKTIFGDRLSARSEAGQKSELLLRCGALNRMTALGMPQSYAL
jgi:IS5 family transposase